jgi:threonine dehydrogenase-like Zn-dependent dehydrogenase
MRALTVAPGTPGSVRLSDVPEPPGDAGSLLVQAIALGICGTDKEIAAGEYGWAPPGAARLILGHESLGRVLEAPAGSGFSPGDLIVGIVRRPDPVPCGYCAAGEWDMCRNGRYTERGIKELDGFGSERFRVEPAFAVKVDPALGQLGVLLEPASVLAKAWAHAERIGQRSAAWAPRTALVTGAGPVGLLAALMGRQRGLEVHVFDRVTDGPKPALVRDLGAVFHGGGLAVIEELAPDLIIECTGAAPVVADVVTRSAPSGIVCLAGMSSGGRVIRLDRGTVHRQRVLGNVVVVGSVKGDRSESEAAAAALAAADPGWLSRLITRRVPLAAWQEALDSRGGDVKVVIDFEAGA